MIRDDKQLAKVAAVAAPMVANPLIQGGVAVIHRRVPGLKTVNQVRREMAYVYRQVWQGTIDTQQAMRLTAILDRLLNGMKVEAELAALSKGYADAWTGIILTGPKAPIDDGNNGAA